MMYDDCYIFAVIGDNEFVEYPVDGEFATDWQRKEA